MRWGLVLGLAMVTVVGACGDECVPQVGTCNCGICVDDFGCRDPANRDSCRCGGDCAHGEGEAGAGGEGLADGVGGRGGMGGEGGFGGALEAQR